ncbi:hypothetical protein EZV62_015086 [Acer yangbiense]|uniref:DUF4283 domain-containing protein n=1 Tax=Acer yangbiense TaxID=1000413 RepID=A0A5C7HTS3_9ROSI|nr:hypothetical protein EZV62_015086 [Acer yangbiense]
MEFNKVEIWVQIHNVPLICMIEDSGNFIGSMIGEVKEVDLIEAKIIGGRIIRVRVVILATEPLMRSFESRLAGSEEITTFLLRYEKLQDYCFKCSRLGHSFTIALNLDLGIREARLSLGLTKAIGEQNHLERTGKKPPESHAGGRSGNFGIRTGLVGEMQGHQNVSRHEGQCCREGKWE